MRIPNERQLQQSAINHLSDIGFKSFMKIYKKCTAKPYSSLANDMTFLVNDILVQVK